MAADNFKPTLWEGALLANFHSVSIADVLATKPTEIKGQKVIFNRVAGGTLKDYSGSVDWDDIDTTPVEMVFDKKKYFAFAEYFLMLKRCRNIIRIDLDNIIISFFLLF